MKDIRKKVAIAAVIFGLGGLGGFAMATNPAQHSVPAARIAAQTGSPSGPVTSGASGAVNSAPIPASNQPVPRVGVPRGSAQDD